MKIVMVLQTDETGVVHGALQEYDDAGRYVGYAGSIDVPIRAWLLLDEALRKADQERISIRSPRPRFDVP